LVITPVGIKTAANNLFLKRSCRSGQLKKPATFVRYVVKKLISIPNSCAPERTFCGANVDNVGVSLLVQMSESAEFYIYLSEERRIL